MCFRAVWTWPGWRSTKPQKVVVFMAVGLLNWRLPSFFRDPFCPLHTSNWKGIAVGLSKRGKGRNGVGWGRVGWGEVMVGRASDIVQDITEIRSKSYQLPGLPQVHQFSPGTLHFGHISPFCPPLIYRTYLHVESSQRVCSKAGVHLQRKGPGSPPPLISVLCSCLWTLERGELVWIVLLLPVEKSPGLIP